ncbi:hypothetical protein ACFWFU_04385 [Streptomyces sp. NPDC060235]|uniref:hypothetical protein n=1 Tax=Streptomyces sp. NPDC060235 TaxID=3347080 RepID=UPI00364B2E77
MGTGISAGETAVARAGSVPRKIEPQKLQPSDLRLITAAGVGTVLTAIAMGWMWGSLAVEPGVLSTFVEDSTRISQELVARQAQCLAGEIIDC